MIRQSFRRICATVIAMVAAGFLMPLLPVSGASAQTSPPPTRRAPRPPRPPKTPSAPIIIPRGDLDLSGLARLDELRFLDMAPFTRGLDELRTLDMSHLSQNLREMGALDMADLSRTMRDARDHVLDLRDQINGQSMNLATTLGADALAAAEHALASTAWSLPRLMDFSSLSDLSQLRSLDQLSQLSSLRSLGQLSDLSSLRSLGQLSDLSSLRSLGQLSELSSLRSFPRWSDDAWSSDFASTLPPEAWQSKDPADSLYRLARKALSSDSYRRASELYRRIRTSYPKSAYTPDAAYWEAFSLQRIGGQQDLKTALDVLHAQLNQFPNAATVNEARALQARLEGQLARLGDSNYAARVEDRATRVNSARCPDESEDERIDALDALIQMDAESALPVLKKVLARRDECSASLRKKAVWLVGSRKTPEAAEIIINTIRNDPDHDVKETAIFWLTNAPSDAATSLLMELAQGNPDLALRERAVYALSQIRDPKARQALKDIVLDNNTPVDLRGQAIYALTNGTRTRASTSFRTFGQTVVSNATSGQSTASTSAPPTEDLLPFLKQVYGKVEQQELKERILYAATQLRSDAARDWMIEIALNPKESSEVRRQAVYTAGSAGATIDQLSAIYDKADDIEVRRQVLYMLSSRKDNAGVDKLLQIARTEKDPEIRKQAIYWLRRTKDPRVIQLLQDIINKEIK